MAEVGLSAVAAIRSSPNPKGEMGCLLSREVYPKHGVLFFVEFLQGVFHSDWMRRFLNSFLFKPATVKQNEEVSLILGARGLWITC